MPRIQQLLLLLILTNAVGWSSSNQTEISRLQAEIEKERAAASQIKTELEKETNRADRAEAELADLKASHPDPTTGDIDRQAAQWLLRAGASFV